MGYSRGSRPGAKMEKTCPICEGVFGDAAERKAHYRKYKCVDDTGRIGGMYIIKGNCAKILSKNREIAQEKRELDVPCLDEEYVMEFPDPLLSFKSINLVDSFSSIIVPAPGVKPFICQVGIDQCHYNQSSKFVLDDLVMSVVAGIDRSVVRNGIGCEAMAFDNDLTCNEISNLDLEVTDVPQSCENEGMKYTFVSFVSAGFLDAKSVPSEEESIEIADSTIIEGEVACTPANNEITISFGSFTTIISPSLGCSRLEEIDSVLDSSDIISVDSSPEIDEHYLCCTHPCDICSVIWEDYEDECDLIYSLFEKRMDFLGIWCDVYKTGSCRNSFLATKLGFLECVREYFPAEKSARLGFYEHEISPEIVVKKLPLMGVTPLDLMAEHNIVPTGHVMLDIEHALERELKKWRRVRELGVIMGNTYHLFYFDDWHEELYAYLYTELVGVHWTQKTYNAFLRSQTPFFLKGFPNVKNVIVASGWGFDPIRFFCKKATMGFLDGCIEKLKEILGPIWTAISFIGDLFVKMKDFVVKFLAGPERISSSTPFSEVHAFMHPLVFILASSGIFKLLEKVGPSFSLDSKLVMGFAVTFFVFILCKFMQFDYQTALRRATKLWNLMRGASMDENESIIEEISEGDPEFAESIRALDREPMIKGKDHIILDIASGAGSLDAASFEDSILPSSLLFKALFLILPISCLGFKNVVSVGKDLSILYGGKEVVSKFTHELIGSIQEAYYNMTGKKAEFLGHLYVTSGLNFEDWRCKVVELTTSNPSSLFLGPQERLAGLRSLRDDASKLITQMDARKVPSAYITSFNDTLKVLDKALVEVQQAMAVGQWRTQPFCVWLYGDSHVGKSMCSQYLIDDVLNEMDFPETGRLYSRNGTDPFFSCYKNQIACLYDDFGAVQEGSHFDEAELIRLIAPAPSPLNMPNLEAKGNTCFTSDFVFITANQAGVTPTAVIHNLKAFENRRNVLVEVEMIPGERYRDRYRFHLLNVNTPYARVVGVPPMDYQAFLQHVVDKATIHREDQNKITNAPHATVFSALEEIATELEDYLNKCETIPEPLCNWHNINMEHGLVNYLREDLTTGFMDLSDNEVFNYISMDFLGAGCVARLKRKLTKSAFKNFKNQLQIGVDVVAKYGEEFRASRTARMLSRTMMPINTDRDLEMEKKGFKAMIKDWYVSMREKISEMPFLFKLLVGFGALFVVGLPVLSFLGKLWKANSLDSTLTLFSTGSFFAAGSLASSGDSLTKRVRNGRERRRYNFEGASWEHATDETPRKQTAEIVNNNDHLQRCLRGVLAWHSADVQDCKVRAFSLGGTRVLFNYHTWLSMPDGCYRVNSLEKSLAFTLVRSKCKEFRIGLKDIVVVDMPKTFMPFPAFNPSFLVDSKTVLGAGKGCFIDVLFDNPKHIDINLEDTDYTVYTTSETYDSTMLKGIGLKTCLKYSVLDDNNKYDPHFFVAGQCGSLLVGEIKIGKVACLKLLSIHCAMFTASGQKIATTIKGGRVGFGSILTREEYDEVLATMGEAQLILEEDLLKPEGNISGAGFENASTVCPLGLLAYSQVPASPVASSIVPSLIVRDVCVDMNLTVQTEPAILHNSDPRAPSGNDIFKKGMLKYAETAADFSPANEEEEEVFYDIIEDIFSPIEVPAEGFATMTEHENLNGCAGEDYCDSIVMSTSEGYPWLLERKNGEKGKGRLLDGIPGQYFIGENSPFSKAVLDLEERSRNMIPCLVGLDTPKDERLPRKKIYEDGKTRLFTILPFEYNFLIRKYFGKMIFQCMKQHNSLPCKVGISPSTIEWTLLGKYLHAKGQNWFNGDYARFDGVTPRSLLVAFADRITKMYANRDKNIRMHLLLASTTRLGIANRGLYRVSGGIPSGFALTVMVNSWINEFLLRWAWTNLMPRAMIMRDHVAFAVYGDDNLVSVSDDAKKKFNLKTISVDLKKYGFTLKDGSNKNLEILPDFNPPEKCDFLKRHFLPYGDRYLCPLSDLSRQERLFWVRKDTLTLEVATAENVKSYLDELFFLGDKERYNHERSLLISICQRNRVPLAMPRTFREQEASWFAEKTVFLEVAEPDIITIPRTGMEISPGISICSHALVTASIKKTVEDRKTAIVWCGPNCPESVRRWPEAWVIEAPFQSKYPLRNTLRKFCSNLRCALKTRGYNRIEFGGALDQDLVYYVAAFYADTSVDSFSMSKFMLKYFGEDTQKHAYAMTCAKGW